MVVRLWQVVVVDGVEVTSCWCRHCERNAMALLLTALRRLLHTRQLRSTSTSVYRLHDAVATRATAASPCALLARSSRWLNYLVHAHAHPWAGRGARRLRTCCAACRTSARWCKRVFAEGTN